MNLYLIAFSWVVLLHLAASQDLYFHKEPLSIYLKPDRSKVTFRCAARPVEADLGWLRNGQPLVSNKKFLIETNKLVVRVDDKQRELSEDHFQCLIHYKGQTLLSNPVKIIYPILENFESSLPNLKLSFYQGGLMVVPCQAPHSVPRAVTEFLHNNSIPIIHTDGHHHFMTSGNLHILKALPEDAGVYKCQAHNPFLGLRRQAHYSVFVNIVAPEESLAPSFVAKPNSSMRAALNTNLTLECAAKGSPLPQIWWKKQGGSLPEKRWSLLGGNLVIQKVQSTDAGTYVCYAKNSAGGPISTSTDLEVLASPEIIVSPENVKASEGHTITLKCESEGYPPTVNTWVYDGKMIQDQNQYLISDTKLTIPIVSSNHAGLYQCFASNEIGSVSASSIVSVMLKNGTTIDSKEFVALDADHKERSHRGRRRKKKNKKKNSNEGKTMIPPTKPEVSMLSTTAVMVSWDMPRLDMDTNFQVRFFKIQLENGTSIWYTLEEDIARHIHAYAIGDLKEGTEYKFRIAVLYENDDNMVGPISDKFILTRNSSIKSPNGTCKLTELKALSSSALEVHWEYHDYNKEDTDGYFVHYRKADTAGHYNKMIAEGHSTLSHIITHLLPNTIYEVKVQAFNKGGVSSFSNIMACHTMPSPGVPFNVEDSVVTTTIFDEEEAARSQADMLYVIVTIVVLLIVVGLGLYFCCWSKTDKCPSEDEEGEIEDEEDPSHYMSNMINISVNPLEAGDKTVRNSNNNEVIRMHSISQSVNKVADGFHLALPSSRKKKVKPVVDESATV